MIDKIPSFEDFMLPLMDLTKDGREHTLGEAIDSLGKRFKLSPEQRRTLLPSGRQPVVNNRIGWARTYLTKAGLLEATGRALFKITDRGRETLNAAPGRIDVAFLERFPEFVQFRSPARVAKKGNIRRATEEVSISISGGRATIIVDAKRLPTLLSALEL